MNSTGLNSGSESAHRWPNSEEIWADLIAGNKRFQAGKPATRELVARRAELANAQHPQVIVLTCSDSRLCPSLIFDKNLGDLFVIRTAGNVADPVALGSIEYAAEFLGSQLLVILGHENCGAVAAASAGPVPTSNLESIVARIRPAVEEAKGLATGDQMLRLAEQANVRRSAADILRQSMMLQRKAEGGELAVIKALYQMRTGVVSRLPD